MHFLLLLKKACIGSVQDLKGVLIHFRKLRKSRKLDGLSIITRTVVENSKNILIITWM